MPPVPLPPATVGSALRQLPYVPAYDGVRAVAVGLVVLMHWPVSWGTLPFGWVGRNLLFVLSGWLITRLLVAARNPDGPIRAPLATYLRWFYARRLRRIWPLYYLYVGLIGGVGLLLGQWNGNWHLDAVLLLTHTQNWRDVAHGLQYPDRSTYAPWFTHLWSVGVEEQYYLLFPWVVWLLPRQWLKPALWTVVLLVPLWRIGLGEWFRHQPPFYLGRASWLLVAATPSLLDSQAVGGLLAYGLGKDLRRPGRWLLLAGLAAGSINLAHWALLRHYGGQDLPAPRSLGFDHPIHQFLQAPLHPMGLRIWWSFTLVVVNILSALLLLWVARPGWANRLLASPPARAVGRLGYGIFMWHFALMNLLRLPGVRTWVTASAGHSLLGIIGFGLLTYGVSWVSFYAFEKRFLPPPLQ